MTLQQLRYVIQAADSRSMNEAAKQLYISQPSLSGAIKDLEEEIGTEILKEPTRGQSSHRKVRNFSACPSGGRAVSAVGRTVCKAYEGKEKIQCFHAALHLCSESICGVGETVWHG